MNKIVEQDENEDANESKSFVSKTGESEKKEQSKSGGDDGFFKSASEAYMSNDKILEKSNSANMILEKEGGMVKSNSSSFIKEGGSDSSSLKKSNSAVKVGKLKHSQTIVVHKNSKDLPNIKSARMLTSQRSLPVEIGEPFEESPLHK